jgi:hypothetical protein
LTEFRLLEAFRRLFDGKVYRPRSSTKGDEVSSYLFEDLHSLARSPKFVARAKSHEIVVNSGNTIQGKKGRRGDGTLGELVPGETAQSIEGFSVLRGAVAQLQIGSEAKTLATKMIAQIDRVMNDLEGQAKTFKKHRAEAITVGIIGVNWATEFTSVLGKNTFDAKVPPSREAEEVERRIRERVEPHYDELVFLSYRASNRDPYPFEWVNESRTKKNYGSALIRISTEYEKRF